MNLLRRLDDRLLLDVNGLGPAHRLGALAAGRVREVRRGAVRRAAARRRRRRPQGADRRPGRGRLACLATLLVAAVNQPVGHVFTEARPYTTHPRLLVLASRTSDFSFPSDHAAMAGAAAAELLLVSRRLGLLAAAAALLMAFAPHRCHRLGAPPTGCAGRV